MTFREKYEQEYADKIARDNEKFPYYGCPNDYYDDPESEDDQCPNGMKCENCWNREMPEEVTNQPVIPDPEYDVAACRKATREEVSKAFGLISPSKAILGGIDRAVLEHKFTEVLNALTKMNIGWTLQYRADRKAYVLTIKEKEK